MITFHEPSKTIAFWLEMLFVCAGLFAGLSWLGAVIADEVFGVGWCTMENVGIYGITVAAVCTLHGFIEWQATRARNAVLIVTDPCISSLNDRQEGLL